MKLKLEVSFIAWYKNTPRDALERPCIDDTIKRAVSFLVTLNEIFLSIIFPVYKPSAKDVCLDNLTGM